MKALAALALVGVVALLASVIPASAEQRSHPPGVQRVHPPAEFDHAYTDGPVITVTISDIKLFKTVCPHSTFGGVKYPAVGCAYAINKKACIVIMASKDLVSKLGLNVHRDDTGVRHEIAHCNGWAGDHPGARTREQAGRAPYDVMAKTSVADWDIMAKVFIEWHDQEKARVVAFAAWKARAEAHTAEFIAWRAKAEAYMERRLNSLNPDEVFAAHAAARIQTFIAWEAKAKADIEKFLAERDKVKALTSAVCIAFEQQAALKRAKTEIFIAAVAACNKQEVSTDVRI